MRTWSPLIVFFAACCFSAKAEPFWRIQEKKVWVSSEMKVPSYGKTGVDSFVEAPEGDAFVGVELMFGMNKDVRGKITSDPISLEGAGGFTATPFAQMTLNGVGSNRISIQRSNGDRATVTNHTTTLMFCIPRSAKVNTLKIGERNIELPAPTVTRKIEPAFPKVTLDEVKWMHDREDKTVPSQTPYGTRLCIRISPEEGIYTGVSRHALGLVTELGQYHPAEGSVYFDGRGDIDPDVEIGRRYPAKESSVGSHIVFVAPSTAKKFLLLFNGNQIARGEIPPFTGSQKRPAYTVKSKTKFKVGTASLMNSTITEEERYTIRFSEESSKKANIRYQPVLGGKFVKVKISGDSTYSTGLTSLLGRHGGITEAFGYFNRQGVPGPGTYGKGGGGPADVIFAVPAVRSGTVFGLSSDAAGQFNKDFPPIGQFKMP